MSEPGLDPSEFLNPDVIPPDVELAELGKDVGAAADTPLEDINPANPHLFTSDLWSDHFARLRAEDPVHFNEIDSAGRYWSIMNYALRV